MRQTWGHESMNVRQRLTESLWI